MEHAIDLDTGHVLRPADVPAYLAHPANSHRLVRVMGVAPFSPPAAPSRRWGTPGGSFAATPRASSPTNDRRN